jgi:transglutaminase-like putative cysteine protease
MVADLRMAAPSLEDYLREDEVVAWTASPVAELAARLRLEHPSTVEFARVAFEHVRDHVAHSLDVGDRRVTLTAGQTLDEGVGLCFAKSHLLVAVLRAGDVPTGLCYQRLCDGRGGHVLHGLVAVHLAGSWNRIDPRGNRPGIDAQFSLGSERLAFTVDRQNGEQDGPWVHVHPATSVVAALRGATDAIALCDGGLPSDLPDL